MAHGLECTRCGYQEAAHDFPNDHPGVCRSYVSPAPTFERTEWDRIRSTERERDMEKRRRMGIRET